MRERARQPARLRLLVVRVLIHRLCSRASSAAGFTLPELLIAGMLGLVVIGSSVGVMAAGLRSEPRIAERTGDVQQAQVMMERITRELRQGATVPVATPSQLALVTFVNSASCGGVPGSAARSCLVTYSCTSGTCTRTEANPDGTGAAMPTTVITGLASDSVFSYSPNAADVRYVGVRLELEARDGDDSITLADGVAIRNRAL